ncbi:MAG TPA: inverse autotransporter beta domain-containing protein [Rhabdochlamydiaceae bacterium]
MVRKNFFSLHSLLLAPFLCLRLWSSDAPSLDEETQELSQISFVDDEVVEEEIEEEGLSTSEEKIYSEEEELFLSDNEDAQTVLHAQDNCGKRPHPFYFTTRHIEANGIGYNQGYTTLEGFFCPPNPQTWVPFLDVRYHIFNNGKPAANAGLGLRYVRASRVWGINGYYDYRKTNHQHYNQVSLGLESLGKVWDFRINGYLPVGKKTSSLFNARFSHFKNHYLYLDQKYEFAMKGANAEAGVHIGHYKPVPVYLAFGPYYLEGQGKVAWGGQARIAADFFRYVRVEASTSYDNVFKWIGQGQVSIIFPFGERKQIRPRYNRTCNQQLTMAQRAVQRVDRMEIISVDRKQKQSLAIDPYTGRPYFFWFVNNTSHSDGTFESPFPMLLQAQNASSPNDVIYVYPGDGTITGMDQGIHLQPNQKLFGAGIDQSLFTTIGLITIPALATGLPMIQNVTGTNTIFAANNNEISGCHILAPAGLSALNGIDGLGVIHANIHDNVIELTPACFTGIFLQDCLGQISITDNQVNHPVISGTVPAGIKIITTSSQTTNYLITGNSIFNNHLLFNDHLGIEIIAASSLGILNISDNHFTGVISLAASASSPYGSLNGSATFVIENNLVTLGQASATFGNIILEIDTSGTLNARIASNQWVNTASPSARVINSAATNTCVSLLNNLSDGSFPAFVLTNNNGALNSFIADVNSNVGGVQTSGTITPGTCP